MSAGWRPVLEGEDAERAREALAAICEDLGRDPPDDPGLYHGQAGLALLWGHLDRCGEEGRIDAAAEALEAATALLHDGHAPWLAGGFAGAALAIAQLEDLIESGDTLADLDRSIGGLLERASWPFEWELMTGLVGLGVYGLERAECPGGRLIVERTAAHLAALAERREHGATWRSRDPEPEAGGAEPVPAAPAGGSHHLGMGYGVLGAVGFLAAARAAGVTGSDPSLLADAVRWLRRQDRRGLELRMPGRVEPGDGDEPGRLNGWCFGDPIAAVVLTGAGLAAGEPDWIDHGLELARHAAAWSVKAAATDPDLSLCHGTLGRAHLLNRLAQATGSSELGEAARACYRSALDRREPGTGIGGFTRISRAPATVDPRFARGLQLGAAGLALALASAVSSVAPAWDRALLICLPWPG